MRLRTELVKKSEKRALGLLKLTVIEIREEPFILFNSIASNLGSNSSTERSGNYFIVRLG